MREKAALILLVISLFLTLGIDVTHYLGENLQQMFLLREGYFESAIDVTVILLIYFLLKRELTFRTKILSMATHDLRNPLGAIRGYAELILSNEVSPQTEREMMTRIYSRSDEILTLVNDLLDSAVLERSAIKLEPSTLDFSQLLEGTVAEFEGAASAKSQAFEKQLCQGVKVFADPARLKQVISNLISNAVKYSDRSTIIKIELQERDGKAFLKVKDQGPGLTASECSEIFESFSKVKKKTTGGESSTGLGLSIAKSLVKMNGGKIWAQSEGPGRGSTFIVELPLAN